MLKNLKFGASALALAVALSPQAARAEKVKIAVIEGLSGVFAQQGLNQLHEAEFAAEKMLNGIEVGGEKLEVEVVGFDGQVNPKESQIQLQKAISQGFTYIVHASGSHIAHALVDSIEKNNKRNPDHKVVYLNYGAVDPALTNDNCSFWHFRFAPHADMKINAMTEFFKDDEDLKSAYLIGQDYSFGKAVAAAARKYLGEKRPDIEIVGDELHPIGKVKDFTPYVQKIKSSGADIVITGNWGADMTNLAKAASDIGLDAKFYTFYAAGPGVSATIGTSGLGRVFGADSGHMNPPRTDEWKDYVTSYNALREDADLTVPHMVTLFRMLGKAMQKAGSTDPEKVAFAMEGMELTTLAGDEVVMRAEDHQILTPIQIWAHSNEGITFDYDGSGYGTAEITSIPSDFTATDSTCEMARP